MNLPYRTALAHRQIVNLLEEKIRLLDTQYTELVEQNEALKLQLLAAQTGEHDPKLLALLMMMLEELPLIKDAHTTDPKSFPTIEGFDIYGTTRPIYTQMGGDFISIYNPKHPRSGIEQLLLNTIAERDAAIRKGHNIKAKEKSKFIVTLQEQQRMGGFLLGDAPGHRFFAYILATCTDFGFHVGNQLVLQKDAMVTMNLINAINNVHASNNTSTTGRPLQAYRFTTGIYAEFFPDGTVKFVNLGHEIPDIVLPNGKFDDTKSRRFTKRPAFGMAYSNDPRLQNNANNINEVNVLRPLERGTVMLFYTDGLIEHINASGGRKPYEAAVAELTKGSAQEIYKGVYQYLDNKVSFNKDDRSLVVVKRTA